MKNLSFIASLLVLYGTQTIAQSGLKQLQISGQASRPTSSLLTVTNFGYGGSIKGIYGFSEKHNRLH